MTSCRTRHNSTRHNHPPQNSPPHHSLCLYPYPLRRRHNESGSPFAAAYCNRFRHRHCCDFRRALLLSGGQLKMMALARALAVGTRLLLLDEPFEGVAPALSQRRSEVIAGLRGSDLAVLISQSDLNHSRSLLDREVVIERGANLE